MFCHEISLRMFFRNRLKIIIPLQLIRASAFFKNPSDAVRASLKVVQKTKNLNKISMNSHLPHFIDG
jgi:hypothetical protein